MNEWGKAIKVINRRGISVGNHSACYMYNMIIFLII